MRPRVAFITTFPAHYRRPLFEELASRFEVDFIFQSAGRERYVSRHLSPVPGTFRLVELHRVSVAGQPVLPGLLGWLTRRRYDAVVKCLNGRLMVPFVYAGSRARGLPFVLWTGMWHHPQSLAHRATRSLAEAIYRGSDSIVVYGEHVKRFVANVPGVDERKIFVAGQAVERQRFVEVRPAATGDAEILFVGQLEERKGIGDLLEAFAALGDIRARLKLIGTGSVEEALRRRAALDHRLALLGHVPQERLPAHLAAARCLVLPSVTTRLDRETWGLVVNEAMHAGVPVVVSDAVGAAAAGLVRNGRNGFVVPERRPDELARALRKLIVDPGLSALMGARARRDADAFTYEAMADAFEHAIVYAMRCRR